MHAYDFKNHRRCCYRFSSWILCATKHQVNCEMYFQNILSWTYVILATIIRVALRQGCYNWESGLWWAIIYKVFITRYGNWSARQLTIYALVVCLAVKSNCVCKQISLGYLHLSSSNKVIAKSDSYLAGSCNRTSDCQCINITKDRNPLIIHCDLKSVLEFIWSVYRSHIVVAGIWIKLGVI